MNLIEGLGSVHEKFDVWPEPYNYNYYREVRERFPHFCPFGCFSIFI